MSPEPTKAMVPTNPMQLIQTALESGMDAEKLTRLVDLAEKWKSQRAACLSSIGIKGGTVEARKHRAIAAYPDIYEPCHPARKGPE